MVGVLGAGIREARPQDADAIKALCALLRADGIPPPDLLADFGSRNAAFYVAEREGQARPETPATPDSIKPGISPSGRRLLCDVVAIGVAGPKGSKCCGRRAPCIVCFPAS